MYFSECRTTADVKRRFKHLAFQFHPDMHKDEFDRYNGILRDIIAEYHTVLSALDGEKSMGTDGKEHTYRYNENTEDGVVMAVARTIRAKLPDNATVTIVGIYVWVEGLTQGDRQAHAALKAAGADRFFFHSKRNAWYWKPASYHASYNRRLTLDGIKSVYGAKVVEKEGSGAIEIA